MVTTINEREQSPRAVTVEQAAKMLSVGRSLMWARVYDGTIRTIRLGHRVLVPVSAIDDLLDANK